VLVQNIKFRWDEAKNTWLKANRDVSFEGVVAAVEDGKLIDDQEHPTRPHQRIMVVVLRNYVCAVPYVMDGDIRFLKTIYPDRKLKAQFQPEE
jgi:uncharacterized DUF497 family protein